MVCVDLVWITVSLCLLAPPFAVGAAMTRWTGPALRTGLSHCGLLAENNPWSPDSADVEIFCSSRPLPFVLSYVTWQVGLRCHDFRFVPAWPGFLLEPFLACGPGPALPARSLSGHLLFQGGRDGPVRRPGLGGTLASPPKVCSCLWDLAAPSGVKATWSSKWPFVCLDEKLNCIGFPSFVSKAVAFSLPLGPWQLRGWRLTAADETRGVAGHSLPEPPVGTVAQQARRQAPWSLPFASEKEHSCLPPENFTLKVNV